MENQPYSAVEAVSSVSAAEEMHPTHTMPDETPEIANAERNEAPSPSLADAEVTETSPTTAAESAVETGASDAADRGVEQDFDLTKQDLPTDESSASGLSDEIRHAIERATARATAETIASAVNEAVSAAVTAAVEQAVASAVTRVSETAAAHAEEELMEHIRACGCRPAENGMHSTSGVRMHPAVNRLTRRDRAALAERAARGETVRL